VNDGFITLPGGTRIPLPEVRWRFSRSSGPGGQHVNRTESRVELEWDIASSPSLRVEEKSRLLAGLAGRIDSGGVLRLVCQQTRSQHRNRAIALERLTRLASLALAPRRVRRPTRATPAAREKRLTAKARRARTKHLRRPPEPD